MLALHCLRVALFFIACALLRLIAYHPLAPKKPAFYAGEIMKDFRVDYVNTCKPIVKPINIASVCIKRESNKLMIPPLTNPLQSLTLQPRSVL